MAHRPRESGLQPVQRLRVAATAQVEHRLAPLRPGHAVGDAGHGEMLGTAPGQLRAPGVVALDGGDPGQHALQVAGPVRLAEVPGDPQPLRGIGFGVGEPAEIDRGRGQRHVRDRQPAGHAERAALLDQRRRDLPLRLELAHQPGHERAVDPQTVGAALDTARVEHQRAHAGQRSGRAVVERFGGRRDRVHGGVQTVLLAQRQAAESYGGLLDPLRVAELPGVAPRVDEHETGGDRVELGDPVRAGEQMSWAV